MTDWTDEEVARAMDAFTEACGAFRADGTDVLLDAMRAALATIPRREAVTDADREWAMRVAGSPEVAAGPIPRNTLSRALEAEALLGERTEALNTAEAELLELRRVADGMVGALEALIEEKRDYMLRNRLASPADIERQHTIKYARLALTTYKANHP
jgi:hypothetical protein